MKKRRPGTISLILALGGFATAAAVAAGVRNSKHDLSGGGGSDEQLCLPCHIPHKATPTQGSPLWSRSVDATKRYLLPLGGRLGRIGSASAVCLSCHDGGAAPDSYGGMTSNLAIKSKRALIGEGGDLSGDHPIGVDYPDGIKGYQPRSFVEARRTIPLPGGKVECTSCHDVHDQSGFDYMLVESNKGSGLCLACHNK